MSLNELLTNSIKPWCSLKPYRVISTSEPLNAETPQFSFLEASQDGLYNIPTTGELGLSRNGVRMLYINNSNPTQLIVNPSFSLVANVSQPKFGYINAYLANDFTYNGDSANHPATLSSLSGDGTNITISGGGIKFNVAGKYFITLNIVYEIQGDGGTVSSNQAKLLFGSDSKITLTSNYDNAAGQAGNIGNMSGSIIANFSVNDIVILNANNNSTQVAEKWLGGLTSENAPQTCVSVFYLGS